MVVASLKVMSQNFLERLRKFAKKFSYYSRFQGRDTRTRNVIRNSIFTHWTAAFRLVGLEASCCSLYVAEFSRAVLIALRFQLGGNSRTVQSNENQNKYAGKNQVFPRNGKSNFEKYFYGFCCTIQKRIKIIFFSMSLRRKK